jgi:hemerythrin-like domain-containing protein
MEEIEKLARAGAGELGDEAWAANVRREAQALSADLEGHFQREEEGFFRIFEEEHPELGRDLTNLRGQHGEVLAIFNKILSRAQGPADETMRGEVRNELLSLLDLLRDHEERENELLQEAVSRDLGDSY